MKGLEGVKVVELTGYVAAPAALRVLGEMGATIYKIEPFTGDEYRTNAPGFGMERNDIDDPAFELASANKNWVSVNLKSEEGMSFVMKMLSEADVVITSFRDKALKKLGLDYETLHEKFPRLVYGQMRGYGERGPEKDSRGFDATAYSSRGGLFMTFPQKNEYFQPANIPAAFGDWNASMVMVAGVLGALVRADRTGEGDKVTVNLYHCACWAMQTGLAGTQHGSLYPRSRKSAPCPTNNTYCSKDEVWFLICFGSYDIYYDLVMSSIGLDEMVGNPEYNNLAKVTAEGRNAEVVSILEKRFAEESFEYWENIFKENEVPYQKLNTLEDVLEDEEAYANDILRKISYDSFGEQALVTSPLRMKSVGDPVLKRSRPVGYETRTVMKDFGYTDAEIDGAVADGAVKCYDGPELPESVFKLSYGPDSITE